MDRALDGFSDAIPRLRDRGRGEGRGEGGEERGGYM